ncbi:uncharacterized protein LOC126845103 [Adelges cooleyi]|uniref:uncharacterized protein LOC126845103 n=1 Tax=Adelges cooleyi TaxID=133065 RepID=UPI00217FDDDB|nr:uncharacterized protein LOC126845103 [Adelges cooleyi]
MSFKFSFILLSFIIAANSVLGESEDENEILKDSYDDCRKWWRKSLDSTISVGEFWFYMGYNSMNIGILEDYFDNNPTAREKQEVIDLNLYGELFKHLCSTLGHTVKSCAALRKNEAASRSIVDAVMLM